MSFAQALAWDTPPNGAMFGGAESCVDHFARRLTALGGHFVRLHQRDERRGAQTKGDPSLDKVAPRDAATQQITEKPHLIVK